MPKLVRFHKAPRLLIIVSISITVRFDHPKREARVIVGILHLRLLHVMW